MMIKVSHFCAGLTLILLHLFLLNQFDLTLLLACLVHSAVCVRWCHMVECRICFDAVVDVENGMFPLPLAKLGGCCHGLVEHIGEHVCCRHIAVSVLCQCGRHSFNCFLEELCRFGILVGREDGSEKRMEVCWNDDFRVSAVILDDITFAGEEQLVEMRNIGCFACVFFFRTSKFRI